MTLYIAITFSMPYGQVLADFLIQAPCTTMTFNMPYG